VVFRDMDDLVLMVGFPRQGLDGIDLELLYEVHAR